MLQDLRFGARMLRKQPGFTAIAVLTLGLGIGATSAIFSLIQGVLLTPPAYPYADRLALIPAIRANGKPVDDAPSWSAAQWMDWQKQAKSLDAIAAYGWTFNFLVENDGSESLEGMYVTNEYFDVTGLQPVLGRAFTVEEAKPGSPPVMLISYDLWKRKFNGDRNVIGRTVKISRWSAPPSIIGVMPPGVRFLPSPGASQEPNYNLNARCDFWVPAAPNPQRLRNRNWDVVARVRKGVTLQQAQTELGMIAAREIQADRDFEGFTPRLEPLTVELNREARGILLPLLGAAILVLLIACGNAAALLLVRGLQRQQEYAVRSALGVGRGGLLLQVATEGLMLSLSGAIFGIALAFAVVRLFKLIGAHAIPRLDAVTTGWPVLVCGLATAVIAGVLASVTPALRASRLNPVDALKSAGPKSSASRGERRLLRVVTIAQTALTLALLVGAGLLIRTMLNIAHVQSGYSTGNIITATVTAVQGSLGDYHRRALARVQAVAGVQNAAFAWGVPLTGNDWPGRIEIEGQPEAARDSDRVPVPIRSVTPGYFDLMALRVVQGRDFRSSDAQGAPPVAIVNQTFVDRFFPHATAVGKKIWGRGRQQPANEIVGVVSDARTDDLTKAAEPEVYLCFWQAGAFSKHLVVRTAADPRSILPAVERELRAVDPTVAIENVKTMEQVRADSLASRTFAMQLLIGFSIAGSILTLVGIYGVLSLSVASRRREIAIRAAVGAERKHLRNLVFGEGLRVVGGGVIAGAALAFVVSRVLRTFLFGVEATDPVTFLAVGILFAAVALLACWAPVRRASSVDPIEALRYE